MPDEINRPPELLQTPNSAFRILVVEDSTTQAELLKRLLTQHGYDVFLARDGAEGLEMAQRQKPDIILSDIMMPVMDGYQMCRKIKDIEGVKHIPVILLTKLEEPEDVVKGLESGADAYVTKPYDEDHIVSKVRAIKDTPRQFRNKPELDLTEFEYEGKTYNVHSGRAQTLSFLISAYESALIKNRYLLRVQEELKALNEHFEDLVAERTAKLEHEISERMTVETNMRDSEERYRALFELSLHGIVLIDPETTRAVDFNRTAHTQLGYSREEFALLRMQDYDAIATPEEIKARIGNIINTVSGDFETCHRTKKGDLRNVLVMAQTIEIKTKPFLHCIFYDITDRKQTEKIESEARANAARIEQLEREIRSFEQFAGQSQTSVTAATFGLRPLREYQNDIFKELTQVFGDLLDKALDERIHKVKYNISGKLNAMAERLGFLKSGPRDVVDIYSATLKLKTDNIPYAKSQAYTEEGRMMVLELMGYLVSYYRKYSMGTRRQKTEDR